MRSVTKMMLLTKANERAIPPLYSTEDVPESEKRVAVKFFDPCGSWTWYVVEGEKQEDGDWRFFGLVDGFEREWGYFMLSELAAVKGRFGIGIERDRNFNKTIGQVLEALSDA